MLTSLLLLENIKQSVYSEEYIWQELDDMDWTIVILPPSEQSGTVPAEGELTRVEAE